MLYRGNHRDQTDARVRMIAGGVALASVLAAGAVFGTVWVADREPSDNVFQLADESDEANDESGDESGEESGEDTEESGDTDSESGDDGEQPVAEVAPDAPEGTDLRRGAVFAQSNYADGNFIVAYARRADGDLAEVGRFPTGGKGSGAFEDSSNGLVVASSKGEVSPNNYGNEGDLLFTTNAGSNSITVFRIEQTTLTRLEVQQTGGERPVSVAISNGLVYVLHNGETYKNPLNEEGTPIENCTTGNRPSVTGFRLDGDNLEPISNSTRELSGEAESGCAQVTFSPNGKALVVTERLAEPSELAHAEGDNGVFVVFPVQENGTLGEKKVLNTSGTGPFGFTFTKKNVLIVAEQVALEAHTGQGSSYQLDDKGALNATGPAVGNFGTDPCWVVVTDDQKYAFVSSALGDGQLSTYAIGENGSIRLHDPVATSPNEDSANDNVEFGATDIALSRDSKYLYQLNSTMGYINVHRVEKDGSLTQTQRLQTFALSNQQSMFFTPFGLASI
jgi:6-phosphogluconolactonase